MTPINKSKEFSLTGKKIADFPSGGAIFDFRKDCSETVAGKHHG
jgi:hypothetical protein